MKAQEICCVRNGHVKAMVAGKTIKEEWNVGISFIATFFSMLANIRKNINDEMNES